jgi:2,3-bisphosphoglycerate-dependent phosphoglycerate mutase
MFRIPNDSAKFSACYSPVEDRDARRYAGLVPDLILLRHGQSEWNELNLFTGWTDVDLTPLGESEARSAGELLALEANLDLRVLHTSVLTRAIRTAEIALHAAGRSWLPVRRNWRLNERHYGDLTGKDKKETAEQFGAEQVKLWRRSYFVPPPSLPEGDPRSSLNDPRYRDVPDEFIPATECLKDVVARVTPYFADVIIEDLRSEAVRGGAVIVVDRRTRDPDGDPVSRDDGRRPQHPRGRLPRGSRGRGGGGRSRRTPGRLAIPLGLGGYSAAGPRSLVRMRTTCSMSVTHATPSPIVSVRAA